MYYVLVAIDFPPSKGGIQRSLHSVYENAPPGCLSIVVPYEEGAEYFDRTLKHKVIRLCRWYWFLPRKLRILLFLLQVFFITGMVWLKKALKGEKVIFHCGHILTAVPLYPLSFIGVKYVVWTHATEIMVKRRKGVYAKVLGKACRVLTVSDFTKDYIITHLRVNKKRICSIRCPVSVKEEWVSEKEIERVRDKYNLHGYRTILTVARLTPLQRYKGIDVSIKAFSKVKKRYPDTLYVIAGEGDMIDEYTRLAEKEGVKESVVFTGRVSDSELIALYRISEIFLMPSRIEESEGRILCEGFGLVFLEANLFNKPVIGGEGGCRSAIIDGETGFIVNPRDPDEIAERVIYLLENPESAHDMGRRGREWALKSTPQMVWKEVASLCLE